MSMTRDQILDAKDLPTRPVEVPEWGKGVKVHVRTLTGLEAESLRGLDKAANFLGRFAAIVLCDEQGDRLFSDDDAAALGKKSNAVLRRISDAAQQLNGMTENEQKATAKN